jgi:hypothetical protein
MVISDNLIERADNDQNFLPTVNMAYVMQLGICGRDLKPNDSLACAGGLRSRELESGCTGSLLLKVIGINSWSRRKCLSRSLASGIQPHLARLKSTDVSREYVASFFRGKEQLKQEINIKQAGNRALCSFLPWITLRP